MNPLYIVWIQMYIMRTHNHRLFRWFIGHCPLFLLSICTARFFATLAASKNLLTIHIVSKCPFLTQQKDFLEKLKKENRQPCQTAAYRQWNILFNLLCHPTAPIRIIDLYPRLNVKDKRIKTNALPFVLHRICLYDHSLDNQILMFKHGCHPVQHMISGLPNIIRHLTLKHLHSLHVEISGACEQIFLFAFSPARENAIKWQRL